MNKKEREAIAKQLHEGLRLADEADLAELNAWSKEIGGPNWSPIPREQSCAFRLGILISTVRDALREIESK